MLCEEVIGQTSQAILTDLCDLQIKNIELGEKMEALQKENKKLKEQNQDLRQRVSSTCPKRINQKLQRKFRKQAHPRKLGRPTR